MKVTIACSINQLLQLSYVGTILSEKSIYRLISQENVSSTSSNDDLLMANEAGDRKKHTNLQKPRPNKKPTMTTAEKRERKRRMLIKRAKSQRMKVIDCRRTRCGTMELKLNRSQALKASHQFQFESHRKIVALYGLWPKFCTPSH